MGSPVPIAVILHPSLALGIESALTFAVWTLLGAGAATIAAVLHQRRERARLREEAVARNAERLAELRSMTGGLAHEIRNPLSTLVLNAQLLREEVMDMEVDEQTRSRVNRRVDAMSREASRLGDILEDFLRFAGRMQLDRQPRDLREVIDELVDFFRPQAERAKVLLRLDEPSEPVTVAVDAGLLKQALLNLMLNAVQAMEGGERRELLVRLERDALGSAPEVRIHVIDTGPGIPVDRRATLFMPYSSTRPGGTGLGLATTRRIVEEHGGRVTLFSEPGIGSDFVLHLPLRGDDTGAQGADSGQGAPIIDAAPDRRRP